LKSDDFFSIDKHPTATIVIKKVEKKEGDTYTLSGDLSQVSYMELVEVIEGKSFMMDCHEQGSDRGPCDLYHTCNISQPIKRFNDYLITIFNALTLNELLSEDNLLALKKHPEKKVEHCPLVNTNSVKGPS
jgi:DNA-binding IscR family transcriptional regulator